MGKQQIIDYWLTGAEQATVMAHESYENKHSDWAFFFWHLAIEKLIKGILTKQNITPPPIHNLIELLKKSNIPLDSTRIEQLGEIGTYNINARYDNLKQEFYHKVMETTYHKKWFPICKEIYKWLKNY